MKNVRVAQGCIDTSRVGLGTASLHHLFHGIEQQALLSTAFDCGIRYFDTAPLYGHGLTEKALGLFARGKRDQIVIATKYGLRPNPVYQWSISLYYARAALGKFRFLPRTRPPRRDFSANQLRGEVIKSLKRLSTDYIDVLLLHEPMFADIREPDALLDALSMLQQDGLIRFFGLSTSAEEFVKIRSTIPGLAQFAQVQFSESNAQPDGALQPDVSFGHFHPRTIDTQRASMATPSGRQRLIDTAVRLNPDGVILFSSRSPDHLTETANAIDQTSLCTPRKTT